jgi:hypothetical protein
MRILEAPSVFNVVNNNLSFKQLMRLIWVKSAITNVLLAKLLALKDAFQDICNVNTFLNSTHFECSA